MILINISIIIVNASAITTPEMSAMRNIMNSWFILSLVTMNYLHHRTERT